MPDFIIASTSPSIVRRDWGKSIAIAPFDAVSHAKRCEARCDKSAKIVRRGVGRLMMVASGKSLMTRRSACESV